MVGIKELVAERAKTHGDFAQSALVAQELKQAMRNELYTKWSDLGAVMQEALDNIQQKAARILTGDPSHRDAWQDIQGYCQLVLDRLPVGDSNESA